jgi:hypothetical protein
MPSYNIKELLEQKTKGGSSSERGSSLPFWKPEMKDYNVRFLPYVSQDGKQAPFQQVDFYDKLSYKLVAPSSFGLEDPIQKEFEKHRKTRVGWRTVAMHLQPNPRFFAVLIVRGEEEKGPQVFEFSADLRKEIVDILIQPDFMEEDLFDPNSGYDFSINVSQALDKQQKPRFFKSKDTGKSYPIKEFSIKARRKPSRLSENKAEAEKWLSSIPKIDEHFKNQIKSTEELLELLKNFIAKKESEISPENAPLSTKEPEAVATQAPVTEEATPKPPTRAPRASSKVNEKKLNEVFGEDE